MQLSFGNNMKKKNLSRNKFFFSDFSTFWFFWEVKGTQATQAHGRHGWLCWVTEATTENEPVAISCSGGTNQVHHARNIEKCPSSPKIISRISPIEKKGKRTFYNGSWRNFSTFRFLAKCPRRSRTKHVVIVSCMEYYKAFFKSKNI